MSVESFKEPGRGEKLGDRRLTNERVKELLDKYGEHGLGADDEFFIIETERGKVYFHKWKDIEGIKIEKHIRKRLGLNEEEGGEKEAV